MECFKKLAKKYNKQTNFLKSQTKKKSFKIFIIYCGSDHKMAVRSALVLKKVKSCGCHLKFF